LLGSAAAAAAFPFLPAGAQDAAPLPDLRSRALAEMRRAKVPALAVAVVRNGRTVAAEGFGLASIPFSASATEHSLFHLGSVSKQFTAATVVALVREARIALDEPIGRYVRDLPPSLSGRPISALLSHTSGVPDYEGLPGFDADRRIERAEFIRKVGAMPSEFAPGQAWNYSNSGYVLLGYLIADVTGRTYHEAVTERLLKPAAFAEARFDDATAIIAGRVEPYVVEGEEVRHAQQMDGDYSGWPDGGLLISAADAGRWESALQGGRVIPPADFALMTKPVTLSTGHSAGYGFGWFTDRLRGQEVHYHTGSVPGFLAYYLRFPAARVGVLVLVNVESGPAVMAMRNVALEAAEAAAPGSTYLSLSPIKDRDPTLTRQALAMIMRGKEPLDPARLGPEITVLPAESRAGLGPPNRARLGAPRTFELVEAYDEGTARVRRYRGVFAARTEYYAFAYDSAGRIFRVRTI
jgi:CubicO group peptidase (beta-lactamase class C family)